MLRIETPGRWRRERPKRRFMGAVRDVLQVVNWSDRKRYWEQGEMELDDPLWRPLKVSSRKKDINNLTLT